MRYAGTLFVALSLAACDPGPPGVQVPVVPPRAEDVASIDAIVGAFYDVISGPPGQPRQWGRDRSLYIPEIRFVSTSFTPDGAARTAVMTHQQFVDTADAGFVRDGFFETEIHRVTHRIGNIAHVFSTYEMRQAPDTPVFGRGVNSLELFWDGARWWIASAVWTDETPGHPIPPEYLPR